ncbi:MAG TPA: FkbM family methyltransferase [Puia sp.]|nr:FkbM family methyltransferase [Puia sp.]
MTPTGTLTFKQKIQNIFFPLGSIQKIRSGYLKGRRILLTENSQWSPLMGKWEPTMQKIMVNVIRPGQVVYDLGANSGLHGLLMAGLVGEEGMVYNFEPLPTNLEEIDGNFKLNGINNYRNVAAAVSDKNEKAVFRISTHAKQGSLSDNGSGTGETVEVECITLDNFIGKGNPGPSFMKIDVEGAESAVLQGFSGSIGKYRPVMIIELHTPEQDLNVGKFLKDHRYTAYRFEPFARLKFTKVKDFTKPYAEEDGIWGTVLCLPPGKDLNDHTFDK